MTAVSALVHVSSCPRSEQDSESHSIFTERSLATFTLLLLKKWFVPKKGFWLLLTSSRYFYDQLIFSPWSSVSLVSVHVQIKEV